MSTILHAPDGEVHTLDTDDYMLIIEALDPNVKVVDTWQKDGYNHFELDYKSAEELLTDSAE